MNRYFRMLTCIAIVFHISLTLYLVDSVQRVGRRVAKIEHALTTDNYVEYPAWLERKKKRNKNEKIAITKNEDE